MTFDNKFERGACYLYVVTDGYEIVGAFRTRAKAQAYLGNSFLVAPNKQVVPLANDGFYIERREQTKRYV